MRSPSQPKNTPPVAAPTRNTAMMAPNHCVRLRRRRRTEQVVQRRTADERKQAHFEAVEHPSEQGSRQRHPSAEVGFGALRRGGCGARLRRSVEQCGGLHRIDRWCKYRMSSPLPGISLRARAAYAPLARQVQEARCRQSIAPIAHRHRPRRRTARARSARHARSAAQLLAPRRSRHRRRRSWAVVR